VLAVKPQLIDEVLPGVAPLMGKDTVLLSIAAGRTLANLSSLLPERAAIVRAMPNTPAAIGRAMTAVCANDAVSRDQALRCTMLLEGVGEVIWIDDENLMDAVTAVSGSGTGLYLSLCRVSRRCGIEAGLDPPCHRLASDDRQPANCCTPFLRLAVNSRECDLAERRDGQASPC
jgi:pyrroline-5-carboxylate reductase